MLMRARREMAQPEQTATHTLIPTPRPGVVSQRASVHPRRKRLAGGEVARLGLSQPVESIMIDNVRHKGDSIS